MEEGYFSKVSTYILIVFVFAILMEFTYNLSLKLIEGEEYHAGLDGKIAGKVSDAMPGMPYTAEPAELPDKYPIRPADGRGTETAVIPWWNREFCEGFWCETLLGINPDGDGKARLWEIPVSLVLWAATFLGGVGLYARMGVLGTKVATAAKTLPHVSQILDAVRGFSASISKAPEAAKLLGYARSASEGIKLRGAGLLEKIPYSGRVPSAAKPMAEPFLNANIVNARMTSVNGIDATWNGKKVDSSLFRTMFPFLYAGTWSDFLRG